MDVLICGGGIAGLTAALLLQKQGHKCQVFEAREDKQTTTSAIILAPCGVRVMAELDLVDSLQAKSQPIRYQRMFNSEGSVLAELSTLGKENYGYDSLGMTRRVLHTILTEKLKELGIPIFYNAPLLTVNQDENGVSAEFKNQGTVRGHILIGADGIHSKVRTLIFPDMEHDKTKDRNYFGCGALVPLKYLTEKERQELKLDEGGMNLINGSIGFVGFIGIGKPEEDNEPKFMFWTHIGKNQVSEGFDCKNMTQVKQVLLGLRGNWFGPVKKLIDMLDENRPGVEALCAPISSLPPIQTWSKGRVVLIGDAAHGYGPGAQGAALAMEDASLLTRLIGRIQGDKTTENLQEAFKLFESKRRPRVERIGDASEKRNDARFEETGPFKRMVKETVIRAVSFWFSVVGYYDANYAYRVEDDL